MHIAIDILAGIFLLFFFLTGWHKGFLLSAMGIARVICSYGGAYLAGRYLGPWLSETIHRPRLITIPACAILTFILITFAFHIMRIELRVRHKAKEKTSDFHLPILSSLSGGIFSLTAGTLSLILLFWLSDLFILGLAGIPIPGTDESYFTRLARHTVYKTTSLAIDPKDPDQTATIAHVISNPAIGLEHLKKALSTPSTQQLISDPQIAEDLLSGNSLRIQQNTSIQRLLNDPATLRELRSLGILSGNETKAGICEKLALLGQNKKVRSSIENLKSKQLLSTDKLTTLIRDPDFDTILRELL